MEVQNQNNGNSVRRERPTYYCLQVTLERLLTEKNISVEQFALDLNFGESSVYEWLTGVRIKNAEDSVRIATYFGIHRDDLEFGNSSDMEKQVQINKLKEEIEERKKAEGLRQLDFMWLSSQLREKELELNEIKNQINKAG